MATNRLEVLQSLVNQNPTDSFARYGLAMEYAKAGQLEEAVTHFRAVIQNNPNYTYAYFHGGQNLEKLGCLEDAQSMYEQGISVSGKIGDGKALTELQAALDLLPL